MFLNKDKTVNWRRLAVAAALVAVAVALGFAGIDMIMLPPLRGFDRPAWHWFEVFFSWKVLLGASVALFLAAYAIKLDRMKIAALNMSAAILLAEFAVAALKVFVGRMRPVMFETMGQTGFEPFGSGHAFRSFPSGHTAAAFAALVSLGLAFPKIKWATWAIALAAGASRLFIGAHFPSDVLAGAFIGMVAADAVAAIRRQLTR
ncbi:MAG: phosphatase PAP2 family protein [Rickettsiales bacterium]|nr:phosphatase PAP2 family protein [Rickettsiales bacterium]